MNKLRLCAGAVCLWGVFVGSASAGSTLDFNTLSHGQIVDNEFSGQGVNISATGPYDLAVAFDTGSENTRDPDLVGPPESSWDGGNVDENEELGMALIVQENNSGNDGTSVSTPDDNVNGGSIFFDFDHDITSFGFDLIDIEGPGKQSELDGYFAAFYDATGAQMGQLDFDDVHNNAAFDSNPPVFGGDNTANRIRPISGVDFNNPGARFQRVEIGFAGSGAIANVNFTAAPSPTAAWAGLLGFGLLACRRRGRRNKPILA